MHLKIITIVTLVVSIVILLLIIDGRRYPTCPKCNGNLNAIRKNPFSKIAHCTRHGDFIPR